MDSTYNNTSSVPAATPDRDLPVLKELHLDNVTLSSQGNTLIDPCNDKALEVDSTMDNTNVCQAQHTNSDETKKIQAKINQLKSRIEANMHYCNGFKDQLVVALRAPIPDDANEYALVNHRLDALLKRVKVFHSVIISDRKMIAMYEKALVEHHAYEKQYALLNRQSCHKGSCFDILESELPKF